MIIVSGEDEDTTINTPVYPSNTTRKMLLTVQVTRTHAGKRLVANRAVQVVNVV